MLSANQCQGSFCNQAQSKFGFQSSASTYSRLNPQAPCNEWNPICWDTNFTAKEADHKSLVMAYSKGVHSAS